MSAAPQRPWTTRLLAARRRVDRALEALLAALMVVLVADVGWQVLTRFVLRSPSSFTEELARYLLVWLGLMSAAYAFGQHQHLAIEGLRERLQRHLPAWRHLPIVAVALAALLIPIGGGLLLVRMTVQLEQRSAALDLPLAVVYIALPTSGILLLFYALTALLPSPDSDGDTTAAAPR